MQSPGNGLALLLCVFSFLFYSSAVGQSNTIDMEPSLRKIQNLEKHQELTARNYVIVDLAPKKILQYYPELKGFLPAASPDELTSLLAKVGANEDLFLDKIPNLSSQEDVTQEKLDSHGWVQGLPVFTGHYNYVIRAHTFGDGIRFNEGRTDANWRSIDPPVASGFTLAQGFALFPLHFHPFHQTQARYRYLGRQVLDTRNDYVVAFAQETEKSQLSGVVTVNGVDFPVAYQGIAWIEPDNFQIVRMRIDLLKPRPEVGSQVTDIQLSEIHLPLVTKPLWLPRDVVVTRPSKDSALREKHQFSDYRVFTHEAKTVPSAQPTSEKPK
jgi:hypothetical protein